jgi:hypothetical protein
MTAARTWRHDFTTIGKRRPQGLSARTSSLIADLDAERVEEHDRSMAYISARNA